MDEKVSRPSPEASGITVRQLTDDQRPFHQSEPYYWYNGSIASTEYFHTYSVLFPEGENFFVRSVMAFMKHPGVVNNAKLQSEVRAFVSQEVHHASTHIRYNKIVECHYGHDMIGVSKHAFTNFSIPTISFVKWLLSLPETYWTFSDTKTNCLAITCSLEHLTATLGEILLATPAGRAVIGRMAPSHRAMWIYHAVEETEHKAVAYDVYQAVGGGYVRRVWMHIIATVLFIIVSTAVYLQFMWDAGSLFNLFSHINLIHELFVNPGMMRRILPMWAEYFQTDFHPNKRLGNTHITEVWSSIVATGTLVADEMLPKSQK